MKDTSPQIPGPARNRRGPLTRPNIVHPTVPGAVGSMESTYREGRDQAAESRMIIDDAIHRITGGREKP